MLIIVGVRTTLRLLGIVTVACRTCRNPAAHRLEERRRVLSLFFVPLIPIGRRTILTCTYCATTSELPDDQVTTLLAHAQDLRPGTAGGAPRAPYPPL